MHAFSPAHSRTRTREGRGRRVDGSRRSEAGAGVSHIPADFHGRVLRGRKSLQPEADEREFAAIVELDLNVGAELDCYGLAGLLDPLEHDCQRFAFGLVKLTPLARPDS